MSPGRGTFPNGLQDERNCQRVTAGERLNGSAGMSRTEGTDGLCPSGNGAVLGPFSPSPCCLQGFAFRSGAAAGERRAMGCGDEPPAVAIATSSLVPATASRAASQTAATSRVFCSGRRSLGIRLAVWRAGPTPPVRLLGSSLPAPKPVRWHQTRSHSTPRPWEQWVTGKSFFLNHYFWRYSDPRIEFMHKIGLLSQGI